MKPTAMIGLTLGVSLMLGGFLGTVLVPHQHSDDRGAKTVTFIQTR
jgi:hypothetical protein